MHSKKTVLIVDLMNAANMELIRLDFRSSALSRHDKEFRRFCNYCTENGIQAYDAETGPRYFRSRFGLNIGDANIKLNRQQLDARNSIRFLDDIFQFGYALRYYSVWNGLRDTLEGYYKNRPRQHNPLSQQKEFRAIKNAIIQEAERLRQQMEQTQTASEQKSSQDEEPSAEKTSTDASTNPTLADENTSSTASHDAQLPSEYLLNSTVRLFHQMGQIFRDNAAPPSNPMGIRIDSKRRKKLMQKRLAMGHKQDDHEQNYGQTLQ